MAPLLPRPDDRSAGCDEILGRFLAYADGLGLQLYPAQEEAISEILCGKHVILATPTGSGKSLVATAFLYRALCEGRRGFLSCPTKALVNEKFFDLCAAFGPEEVGLLTGDAAVNRDAPLLVGTAEILASMVLGRKPAEPPPAAYVVMDEFHYYGDRERGIAWQIPLIALPEATFLLMSATLGDTAAIERALAWRSSREVARVRGVERPVPLFFEYRESPLHETVADLVREGRAPVYLVNFTQRAAAAEAQNLMSVDLCAKPEKDAVKRALLDERARFDTPYGKELLRFLRHGVGLHHAGLLPRYRRVVERLAQRGLLKVISGTDTLGVGINIPIRTVLFTQLCKFDGDKDVLLSVREFQQIAGRAGRKGHDERGYVVAQAPAHVIENRRLAERAARGKKVHPHKPPQKGYVHWDRRSFERLRDGTPEPLVSRFEVSFGILLALLQAEAGDPRRGGGYRRLLELIQDSHESEAGKRRQQRAAAAAFRVLRRAGLIELFVDERARNPQVRAHPGLQRDFSLHHTLSLYLVETLALLNRDSESYAFDVLSLVEAVLENPRPVLMAQLARLREETWDALKAEGVDHEDRIAQVEGLEWPKPNRDFIYATFNAFAERHPWVGAENIAPKSVARSLLESSCGFHDYVRDLGIQRSEGVLLRYLAETHRALARSVPAAFRSQAVEELVADLGAIVRGVDASLLEEWEALRDPAAAAAVQPMEPARAPAPRPLRDLARDMRALAARVRAELHRLLGALARKDWEAALLAVRECGAGEAPPWTPERLAAEAAPYFAEHGSIVTTPVARSPRHTLLEAVGPRRYQAQQRIVDPAGDEDWALYVRVDLGDPGSAVPDEEPLIELLRIGR